MTQMRGSNVSLTDILLTSIHALFIVLLHIICPYFVTCKTFFLRKTCWSPGFQASVWVRACDIPCKTCHFVNDFVILLTIHISEFARIMKE